MTSRKFVLSILLFVAVFALTAVSVTAQDKRAEAELIAALNVPDDSNNSVQQVMLACKQLAVRGTDACVPALAEKLENPRFSHCARYALEPNPSPKVDDAFRNALKTLDGPELVGVINSIGVRRDKAAVLPLMQLIAKSEPTTIKAIIAAAGAIGTPEVAKQLLDGFVKAPSDEYRIAIADACFDCAEKMLKDGLEKEAVEVYDGLAQTAGLPDYVYEAAIYKGIVTLGKDGLADIVTNLNTKEWFAFTAAVKATREIPGDEVGQTLLKELDKLPDNKKAMLLEAIGNRGDKVVLPLLVAGVTSKNEEIRLASIRALIMVGDVSAVNVLFDAAVENDGNSPAAKAARYTLIWIPGDEVDHKIVDVLKNGKSEMRIVAANLVEERRIKEAFPILSEMALDKDEKVRQAAVQAIAETGGVSALPTLFEMLAQRTEKADVEELQRTMKSIAGRLPQEECTAKVIELYEKSPQSTAKLFLLELLITVRGAKSVDFVASQAWVDDTAAKDKATEVLGSWNDTSAAESLLKIAKESTDSRYKIRAIRGYVRLARQFDMSEDDRINICKTVFEISTRDDEKQLIFDVIRRHPTEKMLAFAATFFDNKTFKEKAFEAAAAVADRIQGKPAIVEKTMKQVIDSTSSADIKAKAQRILDRK